MLYIFTALKPEAQAFVDKFKLKKQKTDSYTLFCSDEIVLIVTGMGVINSKKAVRFIVEKFELKSDDSFLNVGICGASKEYKIGELLRIDCIEYENSRYKLSKDIKNIITCKDEQQSSFEHNIVDMESFGFYSALCDFGKIKSAKIFKVVSDHFEPHVVKKDISKKLIFDKIDEIMMEMR